MEEPLSIEETAEKYVRPELRQAFVDLCRKPVGEYIDRFDFKSDLVRAMYAVTDGFSGLYGSWDTPGTGMNFLIHNMCRLPGSDGTWMIVKGGMGTVTRLMARQGAGARRGHRDVGKRVESLRIDGGRVKGVVLASGEELTRRRGGVQRRSVPHARPRGPRAAAGGVQRAHRRLPAAGLDLQGEPGAARAAEVHLPARGSRAVRTDDPPSARREGRDAPHQGGLRRWCSAASSIRFPTIEWYIHTTVDPSLQGRRGAITTRRCSCSGCPTSSRARRGRRRSRSTSSSCCRSAIASPPGRATWSSTPSRCTRRRSSSTSASRCGHIHHVDNGFGFADRLPYATPVEGLYSCSAGCHPAGSVIGAAGHNAANRVLKELKL